MAPNLSFLKVTKFIAGSGAERRSHKKRLEKYYEHVAESLKSVTSSDPECMPETLTESDGLSASPKSQGTFRPAYDRPLPPLRLERAAATSRPESPPVPDPSLQFHLEPENEQCHSDDENFLRRNYSYDDIVQRDGKAKYFNEDGMAYINALKGIGRYRMAVHADQDFQMEVLQRSMSLLDTKTALECNLDASGIDTEVVERYKAMRLEQALSRSSSRSNSSSNLPEVSHDQTRGCSVIRGFSSCSSTSSPESSFDESGQHRRKGSSFSSVSSSEYRRSRHRRRPSSRQPSVHNSTSPLMTIEERPEQRPRTQKQCIFDDGNTESALASDADSEDDWDDVVHMTLLTSTAVIKPISRESGLHAEVAKSRKPSENPKTSGEPRHQTEGQAGWRRSKGLNRSRTVRPLERPGVQTNEGAATAGRPTQAFGRGNMASACQNKPIPTFDDNLRSYQALASQGVDEAWSTGLVTKESDKDEVKPPEHRCGTYIPKDLGYVIEDREKGARRRVEQYISAARNQYDARAPRLAAVQAEVDAELDKEARISLAGLDVIKTKQPVIEESDKPDGAAQIDIGIQDAPQESWETLPSSVAIPTHQRARSTTAFRTDAPAFTRMAQAQAIAEQASKDVVA